MPKTMNELLQTEAPYMKLVADYIKKYASENSWNKVEETQRTIHQCYGYITDQAKKSARGAQSVAIEDATVYQWAIDFYNKDKVDTNTEIKEPAAEIKPKKEAKKPAKKEVEKVYEDEQLSLFD